MMFNLQRALAVSNCDLRADEVVAEMIGALQGVEDWWTGKVFNNADERTHMAMRCRAALKACGLLSE